MEESACAGHVGHPHAKKHHFSFWVAVCFSINYIIGSGFLTLPWAFHQTGQLLGCIVMALFGVFSMQSIMMTLESMTRAEMGGKIGMDVKNKGLYYKSINDVRRHNSFGELSNVITDSDHVFSASHHASYQHQQIMDDARLPSGVKSIQTRDVENATVAVKRHLNSSNSAYVADNESEDSNEEENGDRCVQIVELCKIFMGDTGQRVYTSFLVLYMYGTLWAYSTVFANAFSAHVRLPLPGDGSYYFYLVVFGCMVVPMSLMEFSEQVVVQVSLTAFRILMLCIMVGTILAAKYNGDIEFDGMTAEPQSSNPTAAEMNFDKLYLLLPIAGYAYIFHHSIPALAQPVHDKSSLPRMFGAALVICFVAYVLMAVTVSSFFGKDALPSSNLNWETFTGCLNADGSTPAYAKVIGFFVVLFPALDVGSAYPLNAYTLGNNMMSSYYGSQIKHFENSRFHTSCFRALAAVPPIFAACFVSDLSNITGYTGLTGFGICFIFPPLLAYYSKQALERAGVDAHTLYSNYWTSYPFQVILCVTGVLLFLVVGFCQLRNSAQQAAVR